jgi:predicted  nucleic acid-binding Zn-ribbon protein
MLRIKVKNLKRRVSDVTDSREDWKQRAKTAEAALEESQGEVARLQQALDESRKKRSRPPIF